MPTTTPTETTTTRPAPFSPVDARRVGILCPSGFCGFVAVVPSVTAGGKPVEGNCPKCGKAIDLR